MNNKELNFVLEYLVNEGYTDSYESASKILNVMTEDWLNSILEEVSDDYLERSARASDAALQAARAKRLKAQREQSKTSPVYRDPKGRRVVPGTSKGRKGYFHGKEFIPADQVTGG